MRTLLTVLALLVAALPVMVLPCAAETTSIAQPPAVDAALAGSVAVRLEANRVRVAITGVITPDVAAAFIGALDSAPVGRAVLVELDSPGGFVKAGYAMIDAMLRHRAEGRAVDTLVRGTASCESMCFGVFMAGAKRSAEPGAWFMVHAPRDDRSGTMTLKTTTQMIERLVGLGTSPVWIRRVAERGGFSGSLDYGTRAEALAAADANVVTELVAAR